MMNIAREAIEVTMNYVGGLSNEWSIYNTNFSTRLMVPEYNLRRTVCLLNDEVPLLEFYSDQQYSLITTERVISMRDDTLNEIKIIDIAAISPLIELDSFGDQVKRNRLRVIDANKNEFLIEFDEGKPTYFAMILIDNLLWKKMKGRWFKGSLNS